MSEEGVELQVLKMPLRSEAGILVILFGSMSGLHFWLVLPYKQVQRVISQCSLHVPGSCDDPQTFVSKSRANCWGANSIINVGRHRLLNLIFFVSVSSKYECLH